MRFRISRASDWRTDTKPCDGAVKDGDAWYIEIGTLEEFMELCDKHGHGNDNNGLIVDTSYKGPEITIYDDYLH